MTAFRTCLLVFMGGALIAGCGAKSQKKPDTLLLSIRADATVEGTINRLRFLLVSPEAGLYSFEQFIYFDLKAAPLFVELKQGKRFKGTVKLMIQGLVDQKLVASATLSVDLAAQQLVSVNLRPVGGSCDADGDGVRDCNKPGCCLPGELSDCNDTNDKISPFVSETLADCERTDKPGCLCGNGIDEDCDGKDLDCQDKDGDKVPEPFDCDDNNKDRFPGNTEICGNGIDEDCDGKDLECPIVKDKDKDGYDSVKYGGTDCDDDDPNVNPGKPEICGNQIDENCDGKVEACISEDVDGDGFSNEEELAKCGFVDAVYRAEIHPGAVEPCCSRKHMNLDQSEILRRCDWNCDGQVTFCAVNDKDEDGFDDTEDCNDNDPTI
ncbi:MAG: putative metal-binding motif-containing protein, partial [Myxococcales bacterium]|nr:putative metal-binding motif-containing protein [Myxococcales bacterium]